MQDNLAGHNRSGSVHGQTSGSARDAAREAASLERRVGRARETIGHPVVGRRPVLPCRHASGCSQFRTLSATAKNKTQQQKRWMRPWPKNCRIFRRHVARPPLVGLGRGEPGGRLLGRPVTLRVCRLLPTVRDHLGSPATLKWIAELRGLQLSNVSCVEHLELAEAMATVTTCTYFGWASFEVDPAALPGLRRLAQMLARHPQLRLSIEGHCGLEARYHLLDARQARDYTRRRAEAVAHALQHEAAAVGLSLHGRLVTRAWGYSRPLVWAVAIPPDDNTDVPEEVEALAATNRRVEIFLRSGDFEVPRRRSRSEMPTPPGAPPLDQRSQAVGVAGRPLAALGADAGESSSAARMAAGGSGLGGLGIGHNGAGCSTGGCVSAARAVCERACDGIAPNGLEGYDSEEGGGERDPYTPGTEHGESLVLLSLPSGRRMALPIGLLRMMELIPGEEDMETDSEEEEEGGGEREEKDQRMRWGGVQPGTLQAKGGTAQPGYPEKLARVGCLQPCSQHAEAKAPEYANAPCDELPPWAAYAHDDALAPDEPRLLCETSSTSSSCNSLADQAAAGDVPARNAVYTRAGMPSTSSLCTSLAEQAAVADVPAASLHRAVFHPAASPPSAFPASAFPPAAFPPVASPPSALPPSALPPSAAPTATLPAACLTTAGRLFSLSERASPSSAARELSPTTVKRARK
jgi:outer membrane protein OmpA-like peptidoglycan-associated protein